jgi:hypothetical protein
VFTIDDFAREFDVLRSLGSFIEPSVLGSDNFATEFACGVEFNE